MEDRAKGAGNHPWFAKGNLLMGQVTCRHRSCPAFGRDGPGERNQFHIKQMPCILIVELCWTMLNSFSDDQTPNFSQFQPLQSCSPPISNSFQQAATGGPKKTTVPCCKRCRARLAYLALSFVFRVVSASLSRPLRCWSMKMAAWQWMMRGMLLLKVDFWLEHRWNTGGTNTLMKLKTGRLNQVFFSNNQHPFSWGGSA